MIRRIMCFVVAAVLVAAAALAAGVPNTTKVLIYTERPLAGAEVRALGGELIREYPAYSLYRVPTAALEGLKNAARAKNARIEIADAWDTLVFARETIDTRKAPSRRSIVANSIERRGESGQPRLHVIQFTGPMTEDDQRLLTDAGITSVGYLPHNAVLALARPSAVDRITEAPSVQWTSTYERAHKLPIPGIPESNPTFIVQFVNAPDTSVQLKQFRQSHTVVHEVSYGPYTNFRVQIDPSEADALLDNPVVVAVERAGEERVSGERESIASGASTPGYYPYWYPYQSGSSGAWAPYRPFDGWSYWYFSTYLVPDASQYRIAVADTGLRRQDNCGPARHPDFGGLSITWGTDYLGGTTNCDQDNLGHGTMVAGMAAARATATPQQDPGVGDGTFNYGIGVAPQASLFIQRIIDGSNLDVSHTIFDWLNEAKNNGCVVQTHSHNFYGDTAGGNYTTEAQQYDFAVRDIGLPITVAAGNICDAGNCTQMVLSPATAKNVISVGASEGYRPNTVCDIGHSTLPGGYYADSFDNVSAVSRRGTQDGRFKPDIIAPGTMISSTHAQGLSPIYCANVGTSNPVFPNDRPYDISSGTSFSAPQAAAAISLARAHFSRFGSFSPAMAKAMLIGTAHSARGIDRINSSPYTVYNTYVGPRPNTTQGFGRLYIADLVGTGTNYAMWDENYPNRTPAFTGGGQVREGDFTIVDPTRPTVIVLAWTDEPAVVDTSHPAAPRLVRDLDLTVTNGCEHYSGNYVGPQDTSIQQDCNAMSFYADRTNNVEAVYLPAGYTSQYSTTVLHWKVSSYNWASGASPTRNTQPFVIFGANVY